MQAALASAACFTCGAVVPLLVVFIVPPAFIAGSVIVTCLVSLAALGALGAKTGGVKILRPTLRVLFWGMLSLGLTMLVGFLFALK